MYDEIYEYKLTEDGESFYVPLVHPGVETGLYLINTHGQCYSIKTDTYLRGDYDRDGYHVYRLKRYGKNDTGRFKAHRLTGYQFCEGYDEGLVINHIDCNKVNNHYKNLEWVTIRDNSIHALKNNLHPVNKYSYSDTITMIVCEYICDGYKQSEIYDFIKDLLPPHYNKHRVINFIKDVRRRKVRNNISKDYSW